MKFYLILSRRMKTLTLNFIALLMMCVTASAQTVIKGKVVDGDSGEGIIGANVVVKGTTDGNITDFDGNFEVVTNETGNQELEVSFIGFEPYTIPFNANGGTVNLGTANLASSTVSLAAVEVIADIAIDRKTPVAVSTLKADFIEAKLGNQEFPEVLKSTPGVYTTKGSGGYGDSRINVRGFSTENLGVLVNGAPVNDMENGRVYWSNWAGLSDVTQTMQVQRGLGASKLAIPSVGGTINILTKGAESKKGGTAYIGGGNDGMIKGAMSLSTGLMDNGWAFTVAGSATRGNGYVEGLDFSSYTWFASATKVFNENHTLAFTATGAPQTHNQRANYQWTEKQYEEYAEKNGIDKRRANYGHTTLNGEDFAQRYNKYHKPQINLNHYWTINREKNMELNTTVYTSIGRGNGTGITTLDWSNGSGYNIVDENGRWDAQSIYDNQKGEAAKHYQYNSVNNHIWVGGLSQFSMDLTSDLKLSTGLDLRYYKGQHYQEVGDLIGASHAVDRGMESAGERIVKEGDKVNYNNDGIVNWQGAFAQLEYSKDKLSTFINVAGSNTSYKRIDYFTYASGTETSDNASYLGGSVKGGANYNLTDHHNIFANAGYFSRAPFMNSVFPTYDNNINEEAANEKVSSFELGYGYRSSKFNANVNVYYTNWLDKSMRLTANFGEVRGAANVMGVDALHKGIEIDFHYKPIQTLTITGMASIGDWRWKNNVDNVYFMDEQQNILNPDDPATLYLEDLKVGDAAQTTFALGVDYEVVKGLKFGADYNFFGNLYADFNPESRVDDYGQTTKLKNYSLIDARVSYTMFLKATKLTLFGNVYNLLDTEYIAEGIEMLDYNNGGLGAPAINYGFGRTFSVGVRANF
ncbi:TonB-dependent receptor [Aureibacter tunicatorum]|nr:TonB-dependent receptor [Aureibacter tunicatorum]